jgi:hypothetical protein
VNPYTSGFRDGFTCAIEIVAVVGVIIAILFAYRGALIWLHRRDAGQGALK